MFGSDSKRFRNSSVVGKSDRTGTEMMLKNLVDDDVAGNSTSGGGERFLMH
jgi:hypothetical protein